MMRRQEGFTLIEVIVAAAILIIGIATALSALDSSRRLTMVSERETSLAHRAQLELERVQSLPYTTVALTGTSASWSGTSTDYTYVGGLTGSCPGSSGGPAPTYQPDHRQGGSSATEPLVINGCSYTNTVNGSSTTTSVTTGAVQPVQGWQDGNVTGNIYDFVTWTNDPTCSQTTTPGSNCPTTFDYKRVTVVVSVTNASQPTLPAVVSGYVTPPNSGHDPIGGVGTSCTNSQGQTGSCSNPASGTPQQWFPTDCSYNGTCGTCAGNNLDNTLVSVGLTPPAPDALNSSLPNATCSPPPCYALNVLAGCQGLPLPPTPNCTSPPLDNTKSHSFVTPAFPAGTSITYTGWGTQTAYLQSSNGLTVNANICVGLYVVPSGVLGTLTGNLLSTRIGIAESPSLTIGAVPAPYTWSFNLGNSYTLSSTLLNQVRLEIVIWVAASAGSANVELGYGQISNASQITLQTQ